ncbi:hypothetical protein, partial [Rhodococcus yananensis]|uniref:hypothetical protein n=1 Tax=Rhodococcus yananensis TaxID=2879464 RepID=UPI003EBCE8F9
DLPLPDKEKESFSICDLRRAHLDLWELAMLAQHREAKSDTAYRKVVYLFALLRRYEDDHPGMLRRDVVERLERQPRLWHHRNDGLPSLPAEEARMWRKWAYRKVKKALGVPGRGITDADVQTAIHVLLSLATGEPPEVLRSLTIHDIAASASWEDRTVTVEMSPPERLAYLAENDLIEQLRVRYTKNRAHETYDEVYGRRDTAPFNAFRWALMLSAEARSVSGHSALILMKDLGGNVRQPPWQRKIYRLSEIARRHDLPLTGSNHWGRLRKVATTRDALADPKAYLANGRRHSAKTFFGHYTNSNVLRAEADRILLDSVNEMFDGAIRGPTVVTPDAEDAIRAGVAAPGISEDTAAALVAGDLDGPHAGCRDPLDSPYDEKGAVCSKSITGTCFECPNALITQHHLPAALAIQDLVRPDRAADPGAWQEHWKRIYDVITNVVLPAFSPNQIRDARKTADLTPIEAGVLNDMRGAQEEDCHDR